MWWLDRWGLTPSQVDDLPAEKYSRIRIVAEVQDELLLEQRAEAQKRWEAQQR